MMANLFLSVLGVSASMSLLVAALLLLTSALNKRYAAKWKYLIWICLAFQLLVPFGEAAVQPVADMLSHMGNQRARETEGMRTEGIADADAPSRRVIVEIPAQMAAPIAVRPEASGSITLLGIMAFIWMAGMLTVISVHLFSYLHYKGQALKRGTAIRDARILFQLSKLKRELHIKRGIYAVEYPEAGSPMAIGFFKPVLVLPEGQYSLEELYFILKHELVHLKRGDVYVKLLFMAANAVHWFNPLIWMMHKEAVVDMELSCDERVVQGADFAARKAYTETLLSMLHKRCVKRAALSTQFYGGKKIMKKRFKNILLKTGKKNGICILACAGILTVSLGTLVGCSVAKEEANVAAGQPKSVNRQFAQMAGKWRIDFDVTDQLWGSGISYGDAMEISETGQFSYYIGIGVGGTGQCEDKGGVTTVEVQPYEEHSPEKEVLSLKYANSKGGEQILMDWHNEDVYWKRENAQAADSQGVDGMESENVTSLAFSKEGETEQKQATLVAGNGYSIYLPEGEWTQMDADIWTAVANDRVSLWVTHFPGTAIHETEGELADNGYVPEGHAMAKQDGDMAYKAKLSEYEGDVWGVHYCYPIEAEEGWGRELPVIADTFAVSAPTDGGQNQNSNQEDPGAYLNASARQEIRDAVDGFAAAYFNGYADAMQKYLASTYEGDVSTYKGAGTVSDFTVKGLSDEDEYRTENGAYIISLEFRDSEDADSFWYLTFTFVEDGDGWKIQSYGLEK